MKDEDNEISDFRRISAVFSIISTYLVLRYNSTGHTVPERVIDLGCGEIPSLLRSPKFHCPVHKSTLPGYIFIPHFSVKAKPLSINI
jgi:hypothetical protein